MKLFIIGFGCFILGDFFGFLIAALMVAAGNEDRCTECRNRMEELENDGQASKKETN